MAKDPTKPLLGELSVDATDVEGDLVDLEERARLGMRSEQADYDLVEEEISANQEKFGERAGVTNLTIQEIHDATERIKRIKAKLPAARKLVEILEESIAFHDDRRQRLVHGIAKTVEMQAKARNDKEILAKYEKTRAYRSAIARKAARTRRRNQNDVIDAPVETPVETPAE
jgi:hypothetical protein